MKLFYFFVAIILFSPARTQVVKQPLILNYSAIQSYSKNFSDILSAGSNQASLAQVKAVSFGVYGERKFFLEELNNYTAIIAVPTSSGVFGLEGDYSGSSALNENELGLLYGRKITSNIDAGAKFNYYTIRIPGYGSASAINFETGLIFHLSEKLHTGIHIYNPEGSKLGKSGQEKLAAIYRYGLGYEAAPALFIGAEMVKKENERIIVNAGLQYSLEEKIFIRAGISTLTNNSYAAVGLQLPFARIDVNAAYHPQLGFTPGLLLLINCKKLERN